MSVQEAVSVLVAGQPARDEGTEARKALWGSALGYAMDGFDLLILGFMLRVISADLQLTPAAGRLAGDRDAGRRGVRRPRFRHVVATGSAGCAS